MKFYRNLGAITFEGETPTFQIFTASGGRVVFQLKWSETPTATLEAIANCLNQHYHCSLFTLYSEPHKSQAILLSSSAKPDLKAIPTNHLCTMLIEAARIIQKVSQVMEEWIGNCSTQQFRIVGDRIIFVYLPVLREPEARKRQDRMICEFMSMVGQLISLKDLSHKLLFKKLQKCQDLSEIIQQVSYFASVYCIGRTKLNPTRGTVFPGNLPKRYPASSVKRPSIFKLVLPKSRRQDTSFCTNGGFSRSQHRHSTNALHITLQPSSKHKSAHASEQRASMTSSLKRDSWVKASRVSLKSSQVKEEEGQNSQKTTKRQSKLKGPAHTPVNSTDEEKLLQKLRNKRNTQLKRSVDAADVEPTVREEIKDTQVIQQPATIANQPPHNDVQITKIKSTRRIEHDYDKCETKKPAPANQNPVTRLVEDLSQKSSRAIPTNNMKMPSGESRVNQGSVPTLKKVKKKKAVEQHNLSDEIEVIELATRENDKQVPKPAELSQLSPIPDSTMAKTAEKGWNQNKNLNESQQDTERANRVQAAKDIVRKCRKLNLMGTAVANTRGHLAHYQKIFWQLPLFFIYRGFFIRRLQHARDAEGLESTSKEVAEILVENTKIRESNQKLIKTIVKKLKKLDEGLLESLQPYLNLDEGVNCEDVMRRFVKEYIESLLEAVKKDSDLLIHLVEITDAYLIYKGEEVKQSRRLEAERGQGLRNYFEEQQRLLKKYI